MGAAGTILHYDGRTWTAMGVGTTAHDLYAVLAISATSVLFSGAGGILLNYLDLTS